MFFYFFKINFNIITSKSSKNIKKQFKIKKIIYMKYLFNHESTQ